MPPEKPLNILIVDDEEIVRDTLTALIGLLGHAPECAADGLQGREILMKKKFDAAFVDIRMPGLDGISLLKWSKQACLDLPVIIMTGHGSEDAQREAIESGAFTFFNKPFSIMEIKETIIKIEKGLQ